MPISVAAPAKINLSLDITGVRDDGYHLVETVMQAVSLCDTVTVWERREPGHYAGADRDGADSCPRTAPTPRGGPPPCFWRRSGKRGSL